MAEGFSLPGAIAPAPVDGYGVGTALVTGSGLPTASLVYKLVARTDSVGPAARDADAPWRSVTKASPGKIDHGGRKQAFRRHDARGIATVEVVRAVRAPAKNNCPDDGGGRPLLTPLVRSGETVGREPLSAARERHARARGQLPAAALGLQPGGPALDTIFVD